MTSDQRTTLYGARDDDLRVYLIGPMGCGKSTVGKSLALLLSMPFVDLDEEVERRAGRSIKAIFAEQGESVFRDLESRVLEDSLAQGAVIATGGGVVEREANRSFLKGAGVVFYLRTPPEIQYQRTMNDKNRPLLNAPDRLARLTELFEKRDPLYRSVCHFNVRCDEKTSVYECARRLRYLTALWLASTG